MRLYTRGQVFRASVIAVAVAVLITSAFFKLWRGEDPSSTNKEQTIAQERQIYVQNGQEEELQFLDGDLESKSSNRIIEELDFLQTAPQEQPTLTVANTTYTQDEIQNINVYEMCSEAVVNINTQVVAYDWFLEPYVQDAGSGSGSIIDKRGYILTNVHVIQNATKIYVSLSDGTQYEAEIVGQDADSDLAVIKFNPPAGVTLKTIPFGDSANLKVGQKVIAIGNPYGLARTMTTGIISSLGRPLKDSATGRIINNMIQTDAAINPGNSGGPLLDTSGKMIGINTMIVSNSNSSAGVGFAVPSETAVRVVADLIKYGKVRRGTIDVNVIQLTNRIAQYARLDISSGMLVSQVGKGSLAEKAGIRGGTEGVYYGNRRNIIYLGGDVITKIDNTAITSLADYYLALETKRPGDMVTVTVHRDRKDVQIKVKLDGDSE